MARPPPVSMGAQFKPSGCLWLSGEPEAAFMHKHLSDHLSMLRLLQRATAGSAGCGGTCLTRLNKWCAEACLPHSPAHCC
jgi:hypothetical protein